MAGSPPFAASRATNNVRPTKMAELVATRIRRMIVREELKEGDWLPTEIDLMDRFGVSRPTLREAFRLLEADSLIRIRRGPPGGAQVQLPGPEAAASLFGLILTLGRTTLADVHEARTVIEPPAVRKLAEDGTDEDHRLLSQQLELINSVSPDADAFALATVRFHQRMVELSGNHTLATVTGVLGEVMSRHTGRAYDEERAEEMADNNRSALRAYERVVHLVRERRGAEAEDFWYKHMSAAGAHLLSGQANRRIVDILDQ